MNESATLLGLVVVGDSGATADEHSVHSDEHSDEHRQRRHFLLMSGLLFKSAIAIVRVEEEDEDEDEKALPTAALVKFSRAVRFLILTVTGCMFKPH